MPASAAPRGYAFSIESVGYAAQCGAAVKVVKDAAYDLCRSRIDVK